MTTDAHRWDPLAARGPSKKRSNSEVCGASRGLRVSCDPDYYHTPQTAEGAGCALRASSERSINVLGSSSITLSCQLGSLARVGFVTQLRRPYGVKVIEGCQVRSGAATLALLDASEFPSDRTHDSVTRMRECRGRHCVTTEIVLSISGSPGNRELIYPWTMLLKRKLCAFGCTCFALSARV